MNLHVRRQFKQNISRIKDKLDPQAADIVDDLVRRVLPLKSVREHNHDGRMVFNGNDCDVVFGSLENILEHFSAEIEDMRKEQFATFAENRMYCADTKNLLGILSMYHYVATPTAVICAAPDAHSFVGGKAVFTKEHDQELYGDKRMVYVVVVYKDGFLCFSFVEKIKP